MILLVIDSGTRIVRKNGFKKLSREYGRLKLIDFVLGLIVALATIATVVFLITEVEFLGWGWWSLLGGKGNPMFGGHKDLPNYLQLPLQYFLLLLLFSTMPLAVRWEEKKFRLGAQKRSFFGNLRISFYFGMIHCVGGVPLAAGLALGFVGLYYTGMYLWGYRKSHSVLLAYRRSVRVHLAYNAVVLFILFSVFLYQTYMAII